MSATTPNAPAQAPATVMREAIVEVVNAAWALCDDTANADSEPEVPKEAWQRQSAALDALEALIPESEQPCWPGVAVRLALQDNQVIS